MEYELEELIDNTKKLPTNDVVNLNIDPLNFNNAGTSLGNILVSKVYESSNDVHTRFNYLSSIIGYWLRRCHEGLINEEQALEEIHSYNLANVVPPWSLDKLKQEISNLWKLHTKKYGEINKRYFQPFSAAGILLTPHLP